ncbi:SNF2 family N-terminal domain-containing protein [Chytridium lagenaria]|nr:SNF2 family N-terminal domain-containing protein [Chytridium lagenaria]
MPSPSESRTSSTATVSDMKSLSALFEQIQGPSPHFIESTDPEAKIVNCIINDDESFPELQTKLFEYQRRSVWRMLYKELFLDSIGLHIDGISYVSERSGGILSEDMGTGKTMICIAVLSKTLRKVPRPPNRILLEFMWPSTGQVFRFYKSDYGVRLSEQQGSTKAPPLSVLSVANLLFEDSRSPFLHLLNLPDHLTNACASAKFTYDIDFPSFRPRREGALKVLDRMTITLASTTLFVVPDTLKNQWQNEFNKHCIGGKILLLNISEDTKKPIPDVSELVRFDAILISHSRLASEAKKGFIFSGVPRKCVCPYVGSSRMRDCQCAPSSRKYISPFEKMHLLRIILDEGHLLDFKSSNRLISILSSLKSDSMWISSGTPLPNVTFSGSSSQVQREMANFDKMEGILSGFLRVWAFRESKGLFRKIFVSPWLKREDGAADRIQTLFDHVFVRHKKHMIEAEISLPPMHCQDVPLQMNRQERLNMNVLISQIKLNALLSEKEGNRKHLHQIVENLKSALFYFCGSEIPDGASVSLENAMDEGYKQMHKEQFDSGLFHKIVKHLTDAVSDQNYRRIQKSAQILYVLQAHKLKALDWKTDIEKGNGSEFYMEELEKMRLNITTKLAYQRQNVPNDWKDHEPEIQLDPINAKRQQSEIQNTFVLLATLSSKLTYACNFLLRYAPKHKIIVYTSTDLEMIEISNFCKFFCIKSLLFQRRGQSLSERSQNVTTFNTSSEIKVIIMDIGEGSFGIDLSSASKILFLRPVTKDSRAHRIGSNEKVHVETLYFRDTLEEHEVDMKGPSTGKYESEVHLDDLKMIQLIDRAPFVEENDELLTHYFASDYPLIVEQKVHATNAIEQ